mmetsp:Transcript_13315/g.22040  ORF Transcript_13315/g.22040 Transcript_13315/m.22040 type:complete len:305 (-) Transcript_13315:616-1530(-)|eukprot:CAMPEP_0119010032 /NCGR_PEP_ID=MMETSP1176-20130426/4751_1 /TAXON_ID=265551 /ORGANISM="Synedropsis recta cf, Strain CCMP1620" /LENGTH=304 /DNA_ID=CAMNT_0006962627 /DNA_START=135 /DNA_END=1049 /DNA_ORIENTATION=-
MKMLRMLQNSSLPEDIYGALLLNETGTIPPSAAPISDTLVDSGEGRAFLEFVGFIAWYVLLIVCCIIPPCLAFRRRRVMDRSITLHQREYLQRMTEQVIMFGSAATPGEVEEEYQLERSRRIVIALKATTVTVQAEHLIDKEEEDNGGGAAKPNPTSVEELGEDGLNVGAASEAGGGGGGDEASDLNHDLDLQEESSTMLQLGDVPNGNRQVPASCAICLCGYEVGDSVVISPNQHCRHCFHAECAVPWLSKKIETLCPCCRQEFCDVDAYASQRQQQQRPTQPQTDEEEGAVPVTMETTSVRT